MRRLIATYRYHIAFMVSLSLHLLAFLFCPHLFGNAGQSGGTQQFEVAFESALDSGVESETIEQTAEAPDTVPPPPEEDGFKRTDLKVTQPPAHKTKPKSVYSPPQQASGAGATGAATPEPGIFTMQQVTLLKPLPLPPYPLLARKQGLQGAVTCQVLVTAAGQIKDIKILELQGSRMFLEAVLTTIRQKWHGVFAPHMQAGVPVDGWVEITIPFKLR